MFLFRKKKEEISQQTEQKNKEIILPYQCESELESDAIYSTMSPLKGYIPAMVNLVFDYHHKIFNDSNGLKEQFWRQTVEQEAYKGNYIARAALISNTAHCAILRGENKKSKQYEDSLYQAIENLNPYAIYGYAMFLCYQDFEKSISMLERAGELGLADAYYELINSKVNAYEYNNKLQVSTYDDLLGKYGTKIADCTMGIFLNDLQCDLADALMQGKSGFEKNVEAAIHFYTLAAQNGNKKAVYILNQLR